MAMRSVERPAPRAPRASAATGRRDEEVEARRDALALEQRAPPRADRAASRRCRRRGAPGSPACPRDRAPGAPARARRAAAGRRRRDRRDDLVARRARVGHERAVRLRAALIAEEDLGPLVAHEERRGGADLRRDRREDRALATESSRALGPANSSTTGAPLRVLDARDTTSPRPRRRSSSATSRAQTNGRSRPLRRTCTLTRRAHEHRLPCASACAERRRGDDEREHARCRRRRRGADRRSRRGAPGSRSARGAPAPGSRRPARATRTPCDEHLQRRRPAASSAAGAASVMQRPVVGDGRPRRRLLQPRGERLGEGARAAPARGRPGRPSTSTQLRARAAGRPRGRRGSSGPSCGEDPRLVRASSGRRPETRERCRGRRGSRDGRQSRAQARGGSRAGSRTWRTPPPALRSPCSRTR